MMNSQDVVCACNNITVGDIKDYLKRGVNTYEQLQKDTDIGLYCPPCEEESRIIFEELKKSENL